MTEDSKHSPSNDLEDGEEAVWAQYEADRTDGNRNLVFEFYWEWMQSCVAKWVKKDLDIALSHVAARLLSHAIPSRHLHPGYKPRAYLLCNASSAIRNGARADMPLSDYFRSKHRVVKEAAERLSQEIMRRPTDAEVAEYLGWTERRVILAHAPKIENNTIENGAAEADELYAAAKDCGHDVCADDAFRDYWKNLSLRQRKMLIMRYHDGMTEREIAEEFGCSQSWISRTLHSTERCMSNHFLKNGNN